MTPVLSLDMSSTLIVLKIKYSESNLKQTASNIIQNVMSKVCYSDPSKIHFFPYFEGHCIGTLANGTSLFL